MQYAKRFTGNQETSNAQKSTEFSINALTDEQWESITDRVNKEKITKRLTDGIFFRQFMTETKNSYEDIFNALTKRNTRRSSRKEPPKQSSTMSHYRSARYLKIDNAYNPLIVQGESSPSTPPSTPPPIRKTKLDDVVTPTKHPLPLKQTPNKTRYREIFNTRNNHLFIPVTPSIPKTNSDIPAPGLNTLQKLHYERPDLSVTKSRISLNKITARAGKPRPFSQLQLTGATAQNIFIAEGSTEAVSAHGREYHWSHLIAFSLGGNQDAQNLVPTTACSNYNTLNAIERKIHKQLSESKDPAAYVDVEVRPIYGANHDSLIPEALIYELHWNSSEATESEIHIIKTQSKTPYSPKMLDTFNYFRQADDDAFTPINSLSPF